MVAAVFVRHSPGFDPSNLESVIMDTMHWWRELLKIAIECGQIILSYVVLPKFN